MLDDKIIELGKGIKTNIATTVDLTALAKTAYENGRLTNKLCSDLIIEASTRVAKATTDAAKYQAEAQLAFFKKLEQNLHKQEKINEQTIKAEAAYDNKFNAAQIDAFKNYTTDTMQQLFDLKKEVLDEKAKLYSEQKEASIKKELLDEKSKLYSEQKELSTDKKFFTKDTEAEKYRLDKTLAATNTVIDFSRDATNKTQKTTLDALEIRMAAEEEKSLAQIEIKKWKLYKRTFTAFRWINYFFWPLLGAGVGAVVAVIIMKLNGFLI